MTTESIRCPAGTYGLAVAPWDPGEVYAVAAQWAEASSPVYYWGDDDWVSTGRQVADYRHDPAAALRAELLDAGADDGDIDDIVADATRIT